MTNRADVLHNLEMSQRIEKSIHSTTGASRAAQSEARVPTVVMLDGINITARPRAIGNRVIGYSVESDFGNPLIPDLNKIETQIDFERLVKALGDGLLRLGREANVIGFGDISGYDYQLNVASVHLTSKLSATHRNLIKNLTLTIATLREKFPERVIVAVSSDRDALFAQALHQICTVTGIFLDEHSPVGKAFFGENGKRMVFFSLRCGFSAVEPMVVDADIKHGGKSLRRAFKRLMYLFLHLRITDTLLKQLVVDLGLIDVDGNDAKLTSAVRELWGEGEGDDSQNVSAMVRFFIVMGKLAKVQWQDWPVSRRGLPNERQNFNDWVAYGRFCRCMLEHLTTRGDLFESAGPRYLSLPRMLEIGAELVTMAVVLFRFRGTTMFPAQTYAALIYSVKSSYYAAATCKALKRDCHLYQVADDRLESWFGTTRTASAGGQTMDAADFELLASKVSAVECILVADPSLRATHNRLCSRDMDHVHPQDMRKDPSGHAATDTTNLRPLAEYWERGLAAMQITLGKCVRASGTAGEEEGGKWLKASDLDLSRLEDEENVDVECPQKESVFAGITDWGEDAYNAEEEEVIAADEEREREEEAKKEKEEEVVEEEEEKEKEKVEEDFGGGGGAEAEEDEPSRAEMGEALVAMELEDSLDDDLASDDVHGEGGGEGLGEREGEVQDEEGEGVAPKMVARIRHGVVNGEDYKNVSLSHLIKLHIGRYLIGSKDRLKKYMAKLQDRAKVQRVSVRTKKENGEGGEREELKQILTLETPVLALVAAKPKTTSVVSVAFGLPVGFSTKRATMNEGERAKSDATIDIVLFKQTLDDKGCVLLSTGSGCTLTTKASFASPIDPQSAYDKNEIHIWSIRPGPMLAAATAMLDHVRGDFRSLVKLGPGTEAMKLMSRDAEGELVLAIKSSEALLKGGGGWPAYFATSTSLRQRTSRP